MLINSKYVLSLLIWIGLCGMLNAQDYEEYIGAGNTDGVTITTSSDFGQMSAMNTIDGSGLDAERMAAARFLSQAGFGGSMTEIDDVISMGYENWLNDQLTKPTSPLHDNMQSMWDYIYNAYISAGYEEEDIFGPWGIHFNYTWWENMMTGEDQLRQRIAYALSQILVVSFESNLADYADAVAVYYDILQSNALGNYKDLITDVSLNIAMGSYLSHLNNPKADPANNIHPDENYAREIMQLFTIGLYELNPDGTRQLDSNGDPIPTYDNTDIKELAKVFTGLGPGDINDMVDWTNSPYFGLSLYGADRTVPMIMYENWHEQGDKVLLGGQYTIPSGQSGMQDIDDAIDFLFNHPNVGPFLSYRLIQRLVKSNPSPAYVQRVAQVFNNNGQGERGDLFAVVKAILLDAEARECAGFEDVSNGKLKEPVLAMANFMKGVPVNSTSGNYWYVGMPLINDVGQFPMWAPSVFNFYTPDHVPLGGIADNNLVGPEYKIFNTLSSVGYLNLVHNWTFWDFITYDWESDDVFGDNHTHVDGAWLENMVISEGPEALMNYLDITLTHGKLSDDWRQQIRGDVSTLNWGDWYDGMLIIYQMMTSPDFMIDK